MKLLGWLVIPFEGAVQVAACPIVGPASISIRAIPHPSIRGASETSEPQMCNCTSGNLEMTAQVSTSPVLEPLATESLCPWGSAR
jgi:hypothetical protein